MEARADLNKYSIEYLYQHIDALVRNVPVEPFNYSMVLDAANQGSIVTLMMRHVARYSGSLALSEEEKAFYKNFTSRRVNSEGDSLVSLLRTEESPFLQIKFDEQLTPEQAKKISLIYEELYKAYSVQYIQSTRSLEFKMNLNVFIDNLLEDFFKFKHLEERVRIGATVAVINTFSSNASPLDRLINYASECLKCSADTIKKSEIFESNIVRLVANLPSLSTNETEFFRHFDATGKASFNVDDFNRVVITIRDGMLSQSQSQKICQYYNGLMGGEKSDVKYIEAYYLGMHASPGKTIITLNLDAVMQQILPSIECPSKLLPYTEPVKTTFTNARYKGI